MITLSGELWILLLVAFVLGSAAAYVLRRATRQRTAPGWQKPTHPDHPEGEH